MSDKNENPTKTNNNGGFQVNKHGISCFTCKCRRNLFHKSKKTTTDEMGKTVVEEDIETSSLGFGNRGITPPLQPRSYTLEQRIEDLESKMEKITNKNIADIKAGFKRGVSLDERLLNLEKQVEELKKYHHLKLLD